MELCRLNWRKILDSVFPLPNVTIQARASNNFYFAHQRTLGWGEDARFGPGLITKNDATQCAPSNMAESYLSKPARKRRYPRHRRARIELSWPRENAAVPVDQAQSNHQTKR